MERNISIEKILKSMDKSIIKKVTVFPLKTVLLYLLALAFISLDYFIPTSWSDILNPILILTIIGIILWGFLIGTVDISYYKHLISGQKIHFYEVYFDRKELDKLLRMIDSDNYDKLCTLRISKANSIKFKIASTDDKSLCYVQALKYIPFQFAKSSIAKKLDINTANELFENLNKMNYALQKNRIVLI